MFYAHFVLAKKGPLARIWLAAHWDKKLTKAQVFETNIEKSVEGILQPKVKMALRTTGHLLLGVVRIYSRKAKYLLADCNEAFVKIKMAFRPGMVDLPEENREAAVNAITLPEVFHDFDSSMPDLNDVDIQAQFSLNQSRAEEITMREEFFYNTTSAGDDGFGDMGFGPEPPELMRDATISHSISTIDHVRSDEVFEPEKSSIHNVAATSLSEPLRDDGFGGNLGQDLMAGGLFEGDLFEDTPLPEFGPMSVPASEHPVDEANKGKASPTTKGTDSDDDIMDHFGEPHSVGGASSVSGGSRPPSPHPQDGGPHTSEGQGGDLERQLAGAMQAVNNAHEQTTLIQNEDESFALAPIEASALKGWPRAKRKRKLIVDEIKNISGEEMKSQLSDTSDIVTTLDLAPPTKRLMHWKETGGVEKLFALPGRTICTKSISRMYQRHMTSKPADNEVFDLNDDTAHEQMLLEQVRDMPEEQPTLPETKKSRKRKVDEEQEVVPPEVSLQGNAAMELDQNPTVVQMLDVLENSVPISSIPELPVPQPMVPKPSPQIEVPNMVLEQQLPLLPDNEQLPLQPFLEQSTTEPHPLQAIPPPQTPGQVEMENMGYQHDHPQMTNMGYEPVMQQTDLRPHLQPQTPDVRDYDFPASVGPPEEQQQLDNETYEQFEERVLNKRAGHMHHIIRSRFESQDILRFSEMILGNNRKQVAQKFYTILVLKKQQAIELEQQDTYEELFITKGSKFETCVL